MPAPTKNIGNAAIGFGTVEIAQTFGQVETASLERTIEELGIPDGFGGFQAYLLFNPGYQLQVSAIFPATAEFPADAEAIAFPNGVTGNIINWTVNWTSKDSRKITFTAKQWESIGSNPAVGTMTAS